MTNEARAIPTVISVETPTRMTCWLPGCPLPVKREPGDVVVSPAVLISVQTISRLFIIFSSLFQEIKNKMPYFSSVGKKWPWPPSAGVLEPKFAGPSKPIRQVKA
jgi:hypothetical protein